MNNPRFKKVDDYLKEQLKDPYFKELWELEEQKLAMVKPIIAYRIKHNFTQSQLAQKINVSQQHISNIESGEFTSMETLEKILLFIGYKVRIEAVPITKNMQMKILRSLRVAERIPAGK